MPFGLPCSLPLWGSARKSFKFITPGQLIDGSLELVRPNENDVDAILAACRHPLTLKQSPHLARTTRQQLLDSVHQAPQGRQRFDPELGEVPTYQFWMRATDNPELPIVGEISLRISNSFDTVMYYGNVGYHVYPPCRGHHYAERACRLLLPLARRHGVNPLWITCNPENHASNRTCQRLGAKLIETTLVPANHPLFARGEIQKCRYRMDIPGGMFG